MVKLYLGLSGTGKTKEMIKAINEAAEKESGSVVCIEKGTKFTFDVSYKVRLVDCQEYGLEDVAGLKAFISGLHAGNFDISHVFLKSVHKILGTADLGQLSAFCDWCAAFGDRNGISFTMTATEDPAKAPDNLKKYL